MQLGTRILSDAVIHHNYSGPQHVYLNIENNLRPMELSVDKPICLGRLDPPADLDTVVDLENMGGMEKGVSRCHARISKRNGKLIIEDLGSLNGTFLNAKKLSPYMPANLENGDYVHLGTLLIQVGVF
ncbi:MAG: FHA domain-containing protein [Chloroflexota bacterium]